MTMRQVAEGWELETFEVAPDIHRDMTRPILTGPDRLEVEVDDDGLMIVEGWHRDDIFVRLPLAAVTALMSAHADWVKHTAEARKEATK